LIFCSSLQVRRTYGRLLIHSVCDDAVRLSSKARRADAEEDEVRSAGVGNALLNSSGDSDYIAGHDFTSSEITDVNHAFAGDDDVALLDVDQFMELGRDPGRDSRPCDGGVWVSIVVGDFDDVATFVGDVLLVDVELADFSLHRSLSDISRKMYLVPVIAVHRADYQCIITAQLAGNSRFRLATRLHLRAL